MGSLANLQAKGVFDPLDLSGGQAAVNSAELSSNIARRQIEESQRQFDISETRLEPFFQESVGAFQAQAGLAGSRGLGAQALALQGPESPEIAFQREQGRRQIESQAAATGGLGGGNRLRSLVEFSQGLGQRDLTNRFNRLGVISGSGQVAGTQLAGLGEQFAGQTTGFRTSQLEGQQQALSAGQAGSANLAGTAASGLGFFFGQRKPQAAASQNLNGVQANDLRFGQMLA